MKLGVNATRVAEGGFYTTGLTAAVVVCEGRGKKEEMNNTSICNLLTGKSVCMHRAGPGLMLCLAHNREREREREDKRRTTRLDNVHCRQFYWTRAPGTRQLRGILNDSPDCVFCLSCVSCVVCDTGHAE